MRKMLFLCVQPRAPDEWEWGNSSAQIPGLGANPSPQGLPEIPWSSHWELGTFPGLLESQGTSIVSGNGLEWEDPASPNHAVIPWNSTPHPWLAALHEFCISPWGWGWDFIFSQVFSYLLLNESPKDFCHFTMGRETDCSVAPALILIPANTTLQILECNAKKKKKYKKWEV